MNPAILSLFFFALFLAQPAPAPFSGTVVRVADGDTVEVFNGNEKVKIRIDRID